MQVWTEQLGWRLQRSRGGLDPTHNLHPEKQKIHRRARTTIQIQKMTTQIHIHKNNARKANTPEHTNRGKTFGTNTQSFFFFACGPVCANATRLELRDKICGRFKWCRMLVLEPFSSRARERKHSNSRNHVCSMQRRHSPAAMYANTQLFGWVGAVYARTQFHATGMPRT